MDESQQDQYEERLKEVFNGFDATGAGSLCPEELSALCQALHLEDATPTLLRALLQNPDRPSGRVEFDQFKNALILVLSTTLGAAPPPNSPEVQAKFVRGSKRYGRRSTPEFMETMADVSAVVGSEAPGQDPEDQDDSTVPRKREFEAEGQLHLWNPDEPSTPRGSITPLSSRMEDRVRQACEDLSLSWDECASHSELLALCDHLGLEVTEDVLQVLPGDEVMSVQAFASWYLSHAKPATPSASTPYRQLKRLHSSQPFDETGRRTSTFSSTIGMRLFSTLDDGTGFTPAEYILDAWLEEGIENGPDILQALDFDLEGKVNLSDLTLALENELHMTKNGTHQAALVSFKAEIRSLLEQVDRERREKEKIRSDLEKAERLKTQLATEVDEHHTAIERINDLNLRKLEEEHREKLVSVRSELIREMDQMQQQAGLQREELESEMEKIRDDETFLRDHLSRTVKESRRLEMELLDSTEKLVEAENQVTKLQRNLDNILKEKFGDLDPGSAEFFLQEERIRQLRSSYEEQCRELQDRIDELQTELKEYQSLGRTSQFGLKASLSEELESKSPGMESDPGIGSEEGQPLFSISLEAEMMLEQLKENHLRETEQLQAQLESKVSKLTALEAQRMEADLGFDAEFQELRKLHALELNNLDQQNEELLQTKLDEERQKHQEEKVEMQRVLLEEWKREKVDLEQRHEEGVKAKLEEVSVRFQAEREELEMRLKEEWEREKAQLDEQNTESLQTALEAETLRLVKEQEGREARLTGQWELERAQLQQCQEEAFLTRLAEERLKQQDEVERRLMEEWDRERLQLQEEYEEMLQERIQEERERLAEEKEDLEKRLGQMMEEEKERLEEAHRQAMQDLGAKHSEEREQLSRLLDKLREDIAEQRWPLFVQTQVLDESLQFVNLQSAHLKSDLRMSRHEKDALKQEVISLHKQLQKVSDKNQVLEMALHSSGYQSQHKKMYRDELARLVEQEQHLLRQENERLALELHNTKGDLHHTRERVRNAAMDGGGRAMIMMMKMEERMKEIELSLRNVKLLLKEKVSQLKDQLHKNGKADSLIKDLYVENAQLLKALEMTEQRQKVAEKKNYLLEEKICTLNKIVRDMSPSPLPTLPYHYTCS
uniref:EF-hand domain-containing protein n=1 Tax=Esox lucius TaxID=8010 RepID=A0A3P8YVQ2_ESOLU